MIRSMTGFGEASRETPQGELRVTVKTVNHRFFNAHLRTPSGFDRYESDIQTWLKGFFFRGHVNLTLVLERQRAPSSEVLPELDLERARHFGGLLAGLKEELGLSGEPKVEALLRFGDLLKVPEQPEADEELDKAMLRELVEEAARAAQATREDEGQRLLEDLSGRLEAMGEELDLIEGLAPGRLLAERDRLRGAIEELSRLDEVDEDRLAKEIAYLAERWDINEELVRFRAHLVAFRETLDNNDGGSVGKRLGFLVQEMHREANTIASKANNLEIGHASVAIREEIERLREQLENVE
ncbi:MAG: YicC family protein [Gemmatimonadetes bacterium]|nr:YicC family protein [Gemmatimonadota bacterium]NNM06036.1 YicC family protein [Gemmatimonadota bacterium]